MVSPKKKSKQWREENNMSKFHEQLSSELEMSKSSKEFETCLEEIDLLIKSIDNYDDYISSLPAIYNKYKKQNDKQGNLLKWIAEINWPYNLKPEWRKSIKPLNFSLNFQIADESKNDFKEYLKEEKLLTKYKDEKYIILPLVFNNNYTLNNREELINSFLNIIKQDEKLYNFISTSVELQVQGFLEQARELTKSIDKFRDERVLIYQDFLNEIKNSDFYKDLSDTQKEELNNLHGNIHIVYSEGTNGKYFSKAMEYYKPDLNIRFYDWSSKSELESYFKKLIKNNHQLKTIFIFDCDAISEFNRCEAIKTDALLPLIIPINNNNNLFKTGIENNFEKSLFEERFIKRTPFVNGKGEKGESIKPNKNNFLNYVCYERNNKEDFINFLPLLNDIESFFKE